MKIAQFCSRRLAIVIFAVAALVGWLGRESLLLQAADIWIVSGSMIHADAIVVLGGNSQTRPPVAADLYRRGLANKVVVSHWSDFQLNRAALLKLGVPASAIETFGKANTNTREEAVALKEWAEQNAASVFIIPSRIVHGPSSAMDFSSGVFWPACYHRGSAVRPTGLLP